MKTRTRPKQFPCLPLLNNFHEKVFPVNFSSQVSVKQLSKQKLCYTKSFLAHNGDIKKIKSFLIILSSSRVNSKTFSMTMKKDKKGF